jgi:cyclohexanone monooxygenase
MNAHISFVAAKRLCVDNQYFETFNRDNVTLVSIKDAPLQEVTPTGIRLANGKEYELDMLVFATGYDALTGI